MAERKSNYELVRIIAMLCIVIFHHFGSGAPIHFVELTDGFTVDNYFYDFINNTQTSVSRISLFTDFCYAHFGNGSNLIFMLLTGYFLFGRKIAFSKRIKTVKKIIYAIIFYGVVLTVFDFVICKLWYPFDCFPDFKLVFTLPNWISGENVWYLQAYGVFVLVILPLLKLFESRLTRKFHRNLLLALVFIRFLAYATYLPNLWISTRILDFIMCYYIGGYISKYNIRISLKKLLPMFALYIAAYFAYEYYWRSSNMQMESPNGYSFISVMDPFVCCLIFALLVFLIFNNINISSKVINRISPAVMGIYIFHFNFISQAFVLGESFWWHNWSLKGYVLFVLIDAVILFIVGLLIDQIRQWSYRVLCRFLPYILRTETTKHKTMNEV